MGDLSERASKPKAMPATYKTLKMSSSTHRDSCAAGYGGPLCGVCAEDFYQSKGNSSTDQASVCNACAEQSVTRWGGKIG